MNNRLVSTVLITIILVSILVPTSLSAEEKNYYDENWSYKQEITLPIDTSSEDAHYQPVDIYFEFDNPCWAKNETHHSVIVVYQNGIKVKELDSQIYDLNFSDDNHIESCGLVFLIPEETSGYEKYYVYYDDESKPAPDYENHVDVEEGYYNYEPVTGIFFESWFYKIIDDGYVVYGVSKKGTAMDDPISQQVVKLIDGTTEVLPNRGEITASFAFYYYWHKNDKWDHISTAEHLLKKQILVDGNLMVKFGIVSESNNGALQSKIIYKYYHSPGKDNGIYADVKHEVIDVSLLQSGDENDMSYITLQCGGLSSSTIEELNFGSLLQYLHFYSDKEKVITHKIDQYPETSNWQKIVGKQEDYDFGRFAWISLDNGENGCAYGLIFDSNKVGNSRIDEKNKLDLRFYESNLIQLPGLDGRFANTFITRNAYENGKLLDDEVEEDFVAEFNTKFFKSDDGGHKKVETEADMYQSLIDYQADNNNNDDVVNGDEDGERYLLTVYTYLTQSLKIKLMSARLFLKNPYITVEIFGENGYYGYSISDRISLTEDYWIDWLNISLFRKSIFRNLETGTYLVKVYFENSIFGDDGEFIGYQIVDIEQNKDIHIICKPEGKISLTFKDQNDNGIENVQTSIIKEDVEISRITSDSNGMVQLGVPCGLGETYQLKSTYNGFLVQDEQIRMGLLNCLIPLKKIVSFNVHDLVINIKDSQGKNPDFDVEISLTSDEMQYPVILKPDSVSNGLFKFNNLYPANYTMSLKYDSIVIKEKINVPQVKNKDINLYDYTLFLKDKWDLPAEAEMDVTLISNDFEEIVEISGRQISNGEYRFSNLYNGNYTLRTSYKTYILEKTIEIPNGGKGETTMLFPAVFNATAKVYDSHGNPLKNKEIVITRGGKEHKDKTNNEGTVVFLVPPGQYTINAYSNGELIVKRNVTVLDQKTTNVVTKEEPIIPFIIIALIIIVLIGVGIISIRRKNALFFFKILAASLAVIAIVTPWWSITGSNSDIETSTNMYLVPTEMVTITTTDGVISGELAFLDETFYFVISLMPLLLVFGAITILVSIYLKIINRKKLSSLFYALGLLLFIGSTIMFFIAMSEFSQPTVGCLIGNGMLDVDIPGTGITEVVNCSWGLNIGFYLLVLSTIILALITAIVIKRKVRIVK